MIYVAEKLVGALRLPASPQSCPCCRCRFFGVDVAPVVVAALQFAFSAAHVAAIAVVSAANRALPRNHLHAVADPHRARSVFLRRANRGGQRPRHVVRLDFGILNSRLRVCHTRLFTHALNSVAVERHRRRRSAKHTNHHGHVHRPHLFLQQFHHVIAGFLGIHQRQLLHRCLF